jgi:hypothetical protein
MPPVVRDQDPAGIEHAVGHDVDVGRRHDHASRVFFVERVHPFDEPTVLLDETANDVARNVAGGLRCGRRGEFPRGLRRERTNEQAAGDAREDRQPLPDRSRLTSASDGFV